MGSTSCQEKCSQREHLNADVGWGEHGCVAVPLGDPRRWLAAGQPASPVVVVGAQGALGRLGLSPGGRLVGLEKVWGWGLHCGTWGCGES